MRLRLREASLYAPFDSYLAVFFLEYFRKLWCGSFAVKRLLRIRTVWIGEERALMIHEEIPGFNKGLKSKLLVYDGKRKSFVTISRVSTNFNTKGQIAHALLITMRALILSRSLK